jgi:flagellar capping protein FliD
MRKDKLNQVHHDKCKKPLTNKLLQGDTIEHPLYILEKNLKIDFEYYLSHQIEKPVYQIFELVMKDPKSIIIDLVRKMNNSKNGNHSIKAWLNLGNKKQTEEKIMKADITKLQEMIKNINDKEDEDEDLLKDQFDEMDDGSDEINGDDIEL